MKTSIYLDENDLDIIEWIRDYVKDQNGVECSRSNAIHIALNWARMYRLSQWLKQQAADKEEEP